MSRVTPFLPESGNLGEREKRTFSRHQGGGETEGRRVRERGTCRRDGKVKERGEKGGDGRITKGERVKKFDRGEQRVRKRNRKKKGRKTRGRERKRSTTSLTSQPIAELSLFCLRLQQFPTQLRDPFF